MKLSPACPQCGTPLTGGALAGLCPACLLQQGATSDSAAGEPQASFQPWPKEEIARLFPQLEILDLLGHGGMGAVYKARQPALGRLVALKLLPPRQLGGPDFTQRFNREARALARLIHPHIVAVHEFGQVEGCYYFIMEFVDGMNLRQLQKASRIAPREALQIIPQICDALQYAHDQGVVHRDIKPENVLVDRRGQVKIADFGLAKILDAELATPPLTGEGQVMGTPHYMAPEQVEHPLRVDHRADIYGLGVVFYELLTGELPLGRFPAPSRKVQLDVRLDEIVLRALEKEPARRYQQAGQVKTAVETVAMNPTPPRPAAPPTSAAAKPDGGKLLSRALIIAAAVFGAVFLGAALITATLPRQYASTVRIELALKLPPNEVALATQHPVLPYDPYFVQTEMEKIGSRRVLEEVIARLDLCDVWSARLNGENALSRAACLELLRRSLDIRQSRNTSLIEIRAFAPQPAEAAQIADTVAETARELAPAGSLTIVDRAEVSNRPVRPNVALNLALGAFAGAVLGAGGGLAAWLWLFWRGRARAKAL